MRAFPSASWSLSLALLACACTGGEDITVIRDVTVIDVRTSRAVAHRSVVIDDGLILEVGPADSVQIPPSSRIVDGTGRYLIPGLWDMHVHLRDLGGTLPLFIANGVTTVRDMGSDFDQTSVLRAQIASRGRVGPSVLTPGPILESASWMDQYVNLMSQSGRSADEIEAFRRSRKAVSGPAQAASVVDSLAALGVDFIKIRHAESPDAFRAVGRAARRNGLKLAGHFLWILPLDEAAEAGQSSVEHNVFPGFLGKDDGDKARLFETLRNTGAHLTPTLVAGAVQGLETDSLRVLIEDEDGVADARNRYVSASIREGWRKTLAENLADPERPPSSALRPIFEESNRFLAEAWLAGVPFLAGTDAPSTGIFFGSSLHDELELLVRELGLSEAEALRAATVIPAAFSGMEDRVGTVEPGKRADLVLLNADPLSDIRNTRSIETVIVGGEVHDARQIARIFSAAVDSVRSSGTPRSSLEHPSN